MKYLVRLCLVIVLLVLPTGTATGQVGDPDCSTDSTWWKELQSLGNTFGAGLQLVGTDKESQAAMMFLHAYYKLDLMVDYVPECGEEVVVDLRDYVWLTAEMTLFNLLSSGLKLDPGEMAAIRESLREQLVDAQAKSKKSYEGFKKEYESIPTAPTPSQERT